VVFKNPLNDKKHVINPDKIQIEMMKLKKINIVEKIVKIKQ
jgi:hypothetical protein